MSRYNYTQDDITFLRKYYSTNDWDAIFERFPNCSKQQIYSICSKYKIKSGYKRDSKVANLSSARWTEEENNILIKNYETIPINELMLLLSGRTRDSIICRASKFKLTSFDKKRQLYADEELQYITDNWKYLSDYEMANYLGRTFRSVKWMRESLGLYRQDPDRDLSYVNLERYLRGQLQSWKNASMQRCNYQCVLTGSKDFAIHHLYSFSYIVQSFVLQYQYDYTKNINDYCVGDLDQLVIDFLNFHNQFPLGVCIDKELHKLFHHIYGKNNNTPVQWQEFEQNYKKGKYNH